MKKTRFGIIGCASIARRAFIPALQKSSAAQLVAVASRTRQKANEFAALFDCDAVEGYDTLLAREDIDAVYIATPVGLHAEWALAAARAGKQILCEKTLARNSEETRRVMEMCEASGIAIFEGFAYQFHPQHTMLRRMVEEGQIGRPVLFKAWFGFPPIDSPHRYDPALGGGALLDAGTYTVHAARHFFCREPLRVQAILHHACNLVEIHGSVLLDFGHGQSAHLAFGFDNMYQNTYSIWGTEGVITAKRAFSLPPTFSPVVVTERQNLRKEKYIPPCDYFLEEIEMFVQGSSDPTTRRKWREDALGQAQVLESIRESEKAW